MLIQRRYVVALGVAILAIAAYVAVPKGTPRPPQVSPRQIRAMEQAALQRLRLPHDFKRVDRGCPVGRCYLTSTPAAEVVTLMPELMRSGGIQPLGRLRAAEPVAQLRAAHWSTASRDPLVIACKHLSTSPPGMLETCQDAGRVGPTVINVLVRPDVACHNRVCVNLRKTDVVTWSVALPSGA